MATKITKKDFEKYVKVQMSGRTNMFDVNAVRVLSGLSEDKIFNIMDEYDALDKKYPEVCEGF